MKQWHFYDKVFRRWVVLQISSYEEFEEEMVNCGYKEMEYISDAKAMCVELNKDNNTTDQYCVFMWLKKWENSSLVHELSHLVMMHFEEVGIPISSANTETFAFYMEYWWNEIHRVRDKFPNGRTPKEARL
jgi:hypothetical protein